jgi:hypothetical protein
MLEIARRKPTSVDALQGIPGLTPTVLRRMGEGLPAALRAAAVDREGR